MRVVLVGIAVLAFAGGASLKDLNVSQPDRDVVSGRVIRRSAFVVMGLAREMGR
jgi:hypothetical protein